LNCHLKTEMSDYSELNWKEFQALGPYIKRGPTIAEIGGWLDKT